MSSVVPRLYREVEYNGNSILLVEFITALAMVSVVKAMNFALSSIPTETSSSYQALEWRSAKHVLMFQKKSCFTGWCLVCCYISVEHINTN